MLVAGPVVPVLGALDITLEAVVYGGVTALRVLVVLLAFALYSAAVDPGRGAAAVRQAVVSLGADGVARDAPGAGAGARRRAARRRRTRCGRRAPALERSASRACAAARS